MERRSKRAATSPAAGRRTARRARTFRARARGLWRLLARWLPSPAARRRAWRRFRRSHVAFQGACALCLAILLAAALNGIYQVARKPTELFFPVTGTLYKTPEQTWRTYAPLFRLHATRAISPELLAALAQIEGSGNPLVRTYWRWAWTLRPLEIYRPASSAVGMYQITDGTFDEARRYCVHDHRVVEDGPWYDVHSCWLNWLYLRIVPSHAVELTAAYLQHRVDGILQGLGGRGASLEQQQRLAAVIHLCGASVGARYAKRGFRLQPGQRCGDHRVAAYLSRVENARRLFARLAAESDAS